MTWHPWYLLTGCRCLIQSLSFSMRSRSDSIKRWKLLHSAPWGIEYQNLTVETWTSSRETTITALTGIDRQFHEDAVAFTDDLWRSNVWCVLFAISLCLGGRPRGFWQALSLIWFFFVFLDSRRTNAQLLYSWSPDPTAPCVCNSN